MAKALVLNATYEPLCVVPVRRAVVLVLKEKAVVLHATDQELHSERSSFAVPSVIRLTYFVKVPFRARPPQPPGRVRPRRPSLQYCGAHAENIDHVVPRSRGVSTSGRTWWPPVGRATPGRRTASSTRSAWYLRRQPAAPKELTWIIVAVGTVHPTGSRTSSTAQRCRLTFSVERVTGTPAEVHGRPLPDPITRTCASSTPMGPRWCSAAPSPTSPSGASRSSAGGVGRSGARPSSELLWVDVLLPAATRCGTTTSAGRSTGSVRCGRCLGDARRRE